MERLVGGVQHVCFGLGEVAGSDLGLGTGINEVFRDFP
jgi:hypothetical protein